MLEETLAWNYSFDATKIDQRRTTVELVQTRGQLAYEWRHLQAKLLARSPASRRQRKSIVTPERHPLFGPVPGCVRKWEKFNLNAGGGINSIHARSPAAARKAKL